MKEIKLVHFGEHEANDAVGRELPWELWAFLVRQLGYGEVRLSELEKKISFPEFVPFAEMFKSLLQQLDDGKLDVRPCLNCEVLFDVNTHEGIFADADELEGFLCEGCAKTMTAWDYFFRFLTPASRG